VLVLHGGPAFSFLDRRNSMTQTQLNRAVARATGESLNTVARRGFSIADPKTVHFDPEPPQSGPHVVDWDRLDAQRTSSFPW
jgi:hypothetical protein